MPEMSWHDIRAELTAWLSARTSAIPASALQATQSSVGFPQRRITAPTRPTTNCKRGAEGQVFGLEGAKKEASQKREKSRNLPLRPFGRVRS